MISAGYVYLEENRNNCQPEAKAFIKCEEYHSRARYTLYSLVLEVL
jgi:hypothetical protein